MLQRFLDQHPDYARTAFLDELRAKEFGRLDAQGHVYLDFTGAGLYAASHVREHVEFLETGVFGNPHSANPTSTATTHAVESARAAVLEWFNGAGEYTAIFTPNASGALKLVGEVLPVPRRRPLSADRRQPQFGQRHPRVRARQRRRSRLCAADRSRAAGSTSRN